MLASVFSRQSGCFCQSKCLGVRRLLASVARSGTNLLHLTVCALHLEGEDDDNKACVRDTRILINAYVLR